MRIDTILTAITMKKITAFLIVAYVFAACADLDEVSVQESLNDIAHVLAVVEPEPDTINVNQFEIQRVLNYLNRNDDKPGSRYAVTYETSTICDSEGNEALYIVNYPESGGFYIISARKDGCPVLAFSTEGNFNVSDFKESDLLTWLETSAHQVTHMQAISPDSAALNRKRWTQFEKPMHSNLNSVSSRALDSGELQRLTGIMMNKTCEWMTQNETEFYDYQSFRTRYPDKAEYYDEVLPGGMIYLSYYEDYEQLTMFVEYTETTKFGNDYNAYSIAWSQKQDFAKLFPIWQYDSYGNPIYYAPGCTTIAAAQIMREYQWPEYLPWDKMPKKSATPEICSFLYDLASVSNPNYNPETGETGIFLEDMARTLKSYGYKAKYHSKFSGNNMEFPCIVHSAFKAKSTGGATEHAWYVDGSYGWVSERFLEVWSFPQPNEFRCVDKISLSEYPESSPVFHYVNWGWGENEGNGWYYNIENIAPPGQTNIGMRCMITGIRPNVK